MSFFRFAKFRHQKNCSSKHAFGSVIKICILSKTCRIRSGQNNRLGNNLCIFFCFSLVHQLFRMCQICIHILIDQMKQIVSVGMRGIPQVDDGYFVTVFFCYIPVVPHDITLCVSRQKGHAACTGIFNTCIQPICGFSDSCRTEHQCMNIPRIYHCRCFLSGSVTSHYNSLRQGCSICCGRRHSLFCLPSPPFRFKGNLSVHVSDFHLCRPPCCPMLPVPNRPCLDSV